MSRFHKYGVCWGCGEESTLNNSGLCPDCEEIKIDRHFTMIERDSRREDIEKRRDD